MHLSSSLTVLLLFLLSLLRFTVSDPQPKYTPPQSPPSTPKRNEQLTRTALKFVAERYALLYHGKAKNSHDYLEQQEQHFQAYASGLQELQSVRILEPGGWERFKAVMEKLESLEESWKSLLVASEKSTKEEKALLAINHRLSETVKGISAARKWQPPNKKTKLKE